MKTNWNPPPVGVTGALPVGIALVSFASLLLELALTRLFSVVLYYHFAFLAISLAMLGLGAGGVFSCLWRDWMTRWSLRQLGSVICALNAGAILLSLWVTIHARIFLILEWKNVLRLSAVYFSAGVPFFLTGLLFAFAFAREGRRVAFLYWADLTGGALACLGIVPLLNTLGAPNAVLCAAIAMAFAAWVWADTGFLRVTSVGIAFFLALLVWSNYSEDFIDVVYAKGQQVQGASREYARWNAISRVEVFNRNEGGKWASIDSDAATLIVRADPRSPESAGYAGFPIVNVLRPHGDYAIIGPGGGIDVLAAVVAGSPNVAGIEINPIIADTIMRGRYADYTHHLYELPQVHIHIAEGRSWIRSSRDKYDVIQMSLVDTWASTSAGAFALSENNLYTVDAFHEYFDHLKPDGILAITRWEFAQPREALRVVSQSIAALHAYGIEDVRGHFIVVAKGRLNENGKHVTVLAKKSPFTIEEERAILARVDDDSDLYPLYTPHVYGPLAEDIGCHAGSAQSPHDCVEPRLTRLVETRTLPRQASRPFQQLIGLPSRGARGNWEASPRGEFVRDYPFDISAVTDDNPFFFFTFKTNSVLKTLFTAGRGTSVDWRNNLGLAVLAAMLVISVVSVACFLILPLWVRQANKPRPVSLFYFVAVGLGFILIEMAMIQRLVLFLGHPTYAMTVVVFLLLLSGGAGSLVSRRWSDDTRRLRRVLGGVVVIATVYAFFLHWILSALVGLAFVEKFVLSAMLLIPLGFLMGMPFPTGLRKMEQESSGCGGEIHSIYEGRIGWAWAINATSSVLGSVLSIVIALRFGIRATLIAAAMSYFAAAVLASAWERPWQEQLPVEPSEVEVVGLAQG